MLKKRKVQTVDIKHVHAVIAKIFFVFIVLTY